MGDPGERRDRGQGRVGNPCRVRGVLQRVRTCRTPARRDAAIRTAADELLPPHPSRSGRGHRPVNFPIILSIRAVAPALALGNAVVLKPDPRTAVCGGVVLARIFEEAGLPPGLLSVLPGGAEIGEALVVHPRVRVIAFTGSTGAGRAIGELAGRHLKRTHLELGGNNALVTPRASTSRRPRRSVRSAHSCTRARSA